MLQEEKVPPIEDIVEEPKSALRPNRATRRHMMKRTHHNVFTKKYKNDRTLEAAWRMFLGDKEYKRRKKLFREAKLIEEKKAEEAKIQKGIISHMEMQAKQIEDNNKFAASLRG